MLRILWRDTKRLVRVPVAWIIALALIVLPSLYTWVNVVGFWNPYDNTGNLTICVANEDEPRNDKTAGRIALGEEVVQSLSADNRMHWVFTTRESALDEVSKGAAYAAIVIPPDFSSNTVALLNGANIHPKLEYYVNEKVGPVAPKIVDKGASALDTSINDGVVSQVSKTVSELVDKRIDEIAEKGEAALGESLERIRGAEASTAGAQSSLRGLKEDADRAIEASQGARQTLDAERVRLAALSQDIQNASQTAAQANTEVSSLAGKLSTALEQGSATISNASSQSSRVINRASSSIVLAQGYVDSALARARTVSDEGLRVAGEVQGAISQLPAGQARTELERITTPLQQATAAADQTVTDLSGLSGDISNAATSTSDSANTIDSATQSALDVAQGYRNTLATSTLPALNSEMASLTTTTAGLGASVGEMTLLIDEANTALKQLEDTLGISSSALEKSANLLGGLEDDLATVENDIVMLSTSEALSKLENTELDSAGIAEFMRSPTTIKTEELYPMNAYGSAMAPLFINLTLWIGVFMLMVIMRLEVDETGIERTSVAQRFFARWIFLGGMAALQAIVCCVGCMFIGVQTAHPTLFVITAVVSSLAFLSIQYTLATLFQHLGKAFCVILVFMQIPGASGLYPIEMTPPFFQAVYPIFPFTYGIGAMREAVFGLYGNIWIQDILILLLYLVGFLALGAFARPYLANLNRVFGRQVQESDLIVTEQVKLPSRRYRLSQIIASLADSEAYREQVEAQARIFAKRYPRLKLGALVAGIVIPVVATAALTVLNADKVVVLTLWLVSLVAIATFLIIIEYTRDQLASQHLLNDMGQDEVEGLVSRIWARRAQLRGSGADGGDSR